MKTVCHTKRFELEAPVGILFPLFSPEGEKRWVPGWDYHNVMGTTDLTEDYLFLTKHHDHGATEAIWLVKRYDPDTHLVQFYKIEPGEKVGAITVKCEPRTTTATEIEVTYKYTALSDTGEKFIDGFDADAYEAFIAEWRRLLAQYLKLQG